MSARDDYPYNGGNVDEWEKQTDLLAAEIDRLRADNEQLRANYGLGICQSCAQPVNATG